MSGIIFGAMLDGLGKGASSIGSSAMAYGKKDEDERYKERMQQERLDNVNRNADARIAMMQAGGGGRGSSSSLGDIVPGSDAEMGRAAAMGMDVPAANQFMKSTKSGDWSAYDQEQTIRSDDDPENSDAVSRMGTETRKSAPPWLEAFKKEKRAVLAALTDERTHNGQYADTVKGREGMQEIGARAGIMAGKDPTATSRAYLAVGGKGLFDGGANGSTDKSTGVQKLNDVGVSQAQENRATAGAAGTKSRDDTRQALVAAGTAIRADAKAATTELDKFDEANSRVRKWSEADAKTDSQKDLLSQRARLVEQKEAAQANSRQNIKMLDEYVSKRAEQPTPTPAKAGSKDNPAGNKSPFADGERVRNKNNGKWYVIRGGVPVLEN